MKVAIGTDHGGICLKSAIIDYLKSKGIEFCDFGTFSTDSVDYPDIAYPVAKAVAEGKFDKGILLCGTGIGMSITANKVKGIRAAVLSDEFSAQATAEHNNTNVLALGGRIVSPEKAVKLVDIWLSTPFAGGRHQQRIDKIKAIEEND